MVCDHLPYHDIHDGHIVHGRIHHVVSRNTPSQGKGVHAHPCTLVVWCVIRMHCVQHTQ